MPSLVSSDLNFESTFNPGPAEWGSRLPIARGNTSFPALSVARTDVIGITSIDTYDRFVNLVYLTNPDAISISLSAGDIDIDLDSINARLGVLSAQNDTANISLTASTHDTSQFTLLTRATAVTASSYVDTSRYTNFTVLLSAYGVTTGATFNIDTKDSLGNVYNIYTTQITTTSAAVIAFTGAYKYIRCNIPVYTDSNISAFLTIGR